jgi:cytochrome c oxidase subunit II
MIAPSGIQAERIDELFWAYTDVSAVVFVLVIGALVFALTRKKTPDDAEKKEKKGKAVAGATALTVVTLLVLLVLSVMTSRAMASLSPKDAIQIEVTGRKWWWQFDYADADPSKIITTSYEIHTFPSDGPSNSR